MNLKEEKTKKLKVRYSFEVSANIESVITRNRDNEDALK